MSNVSVLGLGHMGLAIASRLLDGGYTVTVWNRSPEKARALAERGARVASSPSEAVQAGGIAVTMVSDDAALDAVARDIVEPLGDGVHVSMSTVGPDTARRLAELHASRGGSLVSAPVFGRPNAAADGKLWSVVSGDAHGRTRIAPLLDVLTRGRTDLGDDPGAACAVKIGGNLLILAANAALADALALGVAHGVSAEQLATFYADTLFASPMYRIYGNGVASALESGVPNAPGFSVRLARKDVTLAIDAAQATGARLDIAEPVRRGLDAAIAAGLGDADVTGLGALHRGDNSRAGAD